MYYFNKNNTENLPNAYGRKIIITLSIIIIFIMIIAYYTERLKCINSIWF